MADGYIFTDADEAFIDAAAAQAFATLLTREHMTGRDGADVTARLAYEMAFRLWRQRPAMMDRLNAILANSADG